MYYYAHITYKIGTHHIFCVFIGNQQAEHIIISICSFLFDFVGTYC